jgi:pimeloyl-ACP methyl ester carboxylesterase
MFQVHWTDTTGKKHRARTLQIESTDDHSGQEPSVLDRRLDRREVGMKFGAETPTEELLARVLEEASTSDLLLGESPETSSPLGRLRRESIAEWKRKVEDVQGSYWWDIDPNQDALLETGEPLANHLSVIRMRIGSRVMGAMVFATSAFMAPIDVINEEATSVEVIYRPYTVTQIAEFDDYHQALRREISHHRVRRTLVWRLYIGSNTDCIDGTTPEENDGRYVIELGRTERAGFLVGRIAFSVNRVFGRDAKDPTAKLRRRLHENELRQGTANPFCCEDIADVANHATAAAVIAVHGTMACAAGLAATLNQLAGRSLTVLRFEHDTWSTIDTNSDQLVAHLNRLGVTRVLFVAHSRGGLVARLAAKKLAPGTSVEVVTLGTPFRGTPLVSAARGALLGALALLGTLRVVGGPAVDAATRISGFLIRGRLPEGIDCLRPDSSFFAWAKHDDLKNTTAIFGTAPRSNKRNSALKFIAGLAEAVFGGEQNDLVVSSASAAPPQATATLRANCDHFSYLEDALVQKRLKVILDSWPDAQQQ